MPHRASNDRHRPDGWLWHPWPRIQRLIRVILVILETRWGADEWPIVKAELRNALKERSRLERSGWFN